MSIAENDCAVTFVAHHFSGHPARRKGNYTVNNDRPRVGDIPNSLQDVAISVRWRQALAPGHPHFE